MSLDISLMVTKLIVVYEVNITHNLGKMASEAGVYEACWRPEEIGAEKAKDIIPILEKGIALMESDRERFESFAPENGWGTYGNLLQFLRNHLAACKENPEAEIRVSR